MQLAVIAAACIATIGSGAPDNPSIVLAALLLAGTIVAPVPAAIVVASLVALGYVRRPEESTEEVEFHRRVAAMIASGHSLRSALAVAVTSDGDVGARVKRLLMAGRPFNEVDRDLVAVLPVTGRLAVAAMAAGETTGGRTAPAFAALADLAGDEAALEREVRVETAASRVALWVVGGGPLVALVGLAATGRIATLMAVPAGRVVLLVGLALILIGGGVCLWILRRARR